MTQSPAIIILSEAALPMASALPGRPVARCTDLPGVSLKALT
jgi:hypothetical protein